MNTLEVFIKFFARLQLSAQHVLLRVVRAEVEYGKGQLAVRHEHIADGSLLAHVRLMNGLVVHADSGVTDLTKTLTVHELTDRDDGLRVLNCQAIDNRLVFGIADGPMHDLVAAHGPALLALMNRVMLAVNAEKFT